MQVVNYSIYCTLFFLASLPTVLLGQTALSQDSSLALEQDFYKNRYDEQDLLYKITDNSGDGCSILYGTRNMRPVLHGIAYRGGANNYYHKEKRRKNRNPLPNDGVQNLCGEGFSNIIYLYRENAETIDSTQECDCILGDTNTINYHQLDYFDSSHVKKILQLIYESANNADVGPIYFHCWNGWHAAGYIAALSLRQFCGYSSLDAVNYWDLGTDGTNRSSHYQRIRQRIRDFEPYPEFILKDSLGNQICPEMPAVIDSSKLFIGLEHLLIVPESIPLNYPIIMYNVSFKAGKTALSNMASNSDVKTLYKALKEHPELVVEIGGYTDNTGSSSNNQKLSAKRAYSIYSYLLNKGIEKRQLSYKGYGEKKPLFSNRYESTRKKNRRIEIKLLENVSFSKGS